MMKEKMENWSFQPAKWLFHFYFHQFYLHVDAEDFLMFKSGVGETSSKTEPNIVDLQYWPPNSSVNGFTKKGRKWKRNQDL